MSRLHLHVSRLGAESNLWSLGSFLFCPELLRERGLATQHVFHRAIDQHILAADLFFTGHILLDRLRNFTTNSERLPV